MSSCEAPALDGASQDAGVLTSQQTPAADERARVPASDCGEEQSHSRFLGRARSLGSLLVRRSLAARLLGPSLGRWWLVVARASSSASSSD